MSQNPSDKAPETDGVRLKQDHDLMTQKKTRAPC